MSTITIQNLTQVDCAWALPIPRDESGFGGEFKHHLFGDSFNVHAQLTCDLSDEEQVVIDFGAAKKAIKAFIDGPNGPDHKTINVNDALYDALRSSWKMAEGSIHNLSISNDIYPQYARMAGEEGEGMAWESYSTPDSQLTYLTSQLLGWLEVKLRHELREQFNVPVDVVLTHDREFTFPKVKYDAIASQRVRYMHGLQNSTAFGCQNILHGHLSVVHVYFDRAGFDTSREVAARTVALNDAVKDIFGLKHHQSAYVYGTRTEHDCGIVEYTSKSRGFQQIDLMGATCIAHAIPCPDTTVENLADWLASQLKPVCASLGIQSARLYLSEGLTKGAIAKIC